MYKVHAPHLRSGYLAGVEFQEQQTASGEPDWLMLYTPGRRAQDEFREANRKLQPRAAKATKPSRKIPAAPSPAPTEPQAPAQLGEADEAGAQLVSRLIGFHVASATARELVRDYRKSVELQLRALPHRNTGKIKYLAPWLIQAIKENYELPEGFKSTLEKEEEVRRQLVNVSSR